jgi:hypothetical protein
MNPKPVIFFLQRKPEYPMPQYSWLGKIHKHLNILHSMEEKKKAGQIVISHMISKDFIVLSLYLSQIK